MPADHSGAGRPIRTCVGCGGRYPKQELERYVWGGSEPVADPEQRLRGRGAYCCRNEQCSDRLRRARKKWSYLFRLS